MTQAPAPIPVTTPSDLPRASLVSYFYKFLCLSVLYPLEETYPKSQGDRSTMHCKNDGRRAKLFFRVCGAKDPISVTQLFLSSLHGAPCHCLKIQEMGSIGYEAHDIKIRKSSGQLFLDYGYIVPETVSEINNAHRSIFG
jgi:hypothetical protein